MHRETVFQAMHTARIFRHIAANRAGDLRGWIRRIVQTIRRGRLTDCQIPDTGLNTCRACQRIDFNNLL